jgi:ubiquitin carboxyl-terminal hydrolase L5
MHVTSSWHSRIAHETSLQLEFNLMAIHEDTIPKLESQIRSFQAQGNDLASAEFTARLAQENEKRERWAVRTILHSNASEPLTIS